VSLRLLVLDAYAPEGRAELRAGGCTEAGELYARVLRELRPQARVEVGYPADASWELPAGVALRDYDGLVWTGSSLTIHDVGDSRVRRQIELTRRAYREAVPAFGSCWAAQLAVTAAGGRCARHPKGREFGIARHIEVNAEGRGHPLFAGRAPDPFDAFTSHQDEIVELPPGATLLASNAWSRVQAVAVAHESGRFWAVQYHPEYDLHEIAALSRVRWSGLVAQGMFSAEQEVRAWAAAAERVADEGDEAAAKALGIGAELRADAARRAEVEAWLQSLPRDASG
jgi:GMP synthase (glutamine-hydrolysing)